MRIAGSGMRLRGGALVKKHIRRINIHHKRHIKKLQAHHKRAAGELSKHFAKIIHHSAAFTGLAAHRAAKASWKGAKSVATQLYRGMVPKKPKGLTRKAGAGWGFLSSGWDWAKKQFNAHAKDHLVKMKDEAIKHVKKEAAAMGKQALESGKAYAMKHGKALLDKGKATLSNARSAAEARVKKHVTKYADKAKSKLEGYAGKLHGKMDQLNNKMSGYKDF